MLQETKSETLDQLKLDINSSAPLNVQVSDLLRNLITTKFTPGDMLYSENLLTRRLGVSRVTVRRALIDLQNEGLLVRFAGRGTIVADGLLRSPSGSLRQTRSEKQAENYAPSTQRNLIRVFASANAAGDDSEYGRAMTQRLALAAANMGYGIQITVVRNINDVTEAVSQVVRTPDEEAIIIFVGYMTQAIFDALNPRGYRTISLDQMPDRYEGSTVVTDHRGAVRVGLKHLIDLGHERIVLLANEPLREPSVIDKVEEFFTVVRSHGLHKKCRVVVCGTHYGQKSYDTAFEHMDEVWAAGHADSPTAIFTVSDPGGWAALRWLSEHGVRVPEDVSVLGFEGAISSQFMHPTMSTVAHSVDKIAETAIKLLWEGPMPGAVTLIEPELIARESTGPPPDRRESVS